MRVPNSSNLEIGVSMFMSRFVLLQLHMFAARILQMIRQFYDGFVYSSHGSHHLAVSRTKSIMSDLRQYVMRYGHR